MTDLPAAGDRFAQVLGDQPAGSDRPDDPFAVLELHITSPMSAQDPDDLIAALRAQAQTAARRIRAIAALRDAGWQMAAPSLRVEDPEALLGQLQTEVAAKDSGEQSSAPVVLAEDTHLDFDIRFRKRFAKEREALTEAAGLDLHDGDDNWDFGWDEQADGSVRWWTEAPLPEKPWF